MEPVTLYVVSEPRESSSMFRLSSVRVGTRLALAFVVVLALLCALAGVGLSLAGHEQTATRDDQRRQQAIEVIAALKFDAGAVALDENSVAYDYASLSDPADDVSSLQSDRAAFAAQLNKASALTLTTAERGLLQQAEAAFTTYGSQADTINAAFQQGTGASLAAAHRGVAALHYGSIADPLAKLASSLDSAANSAITHRVHAARSSRTQIIAFALLAVLAAIGLGLVLTRSITRPLRALDAVLSAVASGDLTGRVTTRARDEVGQLSRALNKALDRVGETLRRVAGGATTLASSAEELSATSHQIAVAAEEASSQVSVVSTTADQVSHNVQTVAAGAEQVGASIREISQSATDAASVARQAVAAAQEANATVGQLGESSSEIGNVVKLITSIAEQTNLLALNATIEAARAGASGKGFAVVAGEVKELAQQTAQATEDISRRVAAIQSDSDEAAAAITRISDVIGRINDYQTTIASAVEEQTAVTHEMGRNVTDAATGTSDIAGSIAAVAGATSATSQGVTQTTAAADQLARLSSELQSAISSYRF